MTTPSNIRVAILGATGYVGGELVRLLAGHPAVRITVVSSLRYAGQRIGEVFPALTPLGDLTLTALDAERIAGQADVVLSALPHGQSAELLGALHAKGLPVIDLSADYRFPDPALYETVYGHPHPCPELARQTVYGLVEHNRAAIAGASLIGVPGCYPTATLLALIPLIRGGWIDIGQDVVVDAKSGVSGAGREAKTANLYCEVAEGIRPYNVGSHRHQPEIGYHAAAFGGGTVPVFFTPSVVPMARGILATVYATAAAGVIADHVALTDHFATVYADSPCVEVLPAGVLPATRQVTGTNRCAIGIAADPVTGRIAVFSAIDNLIKGAAGQAVQCLNLYLGLPETTALPLLSPIA